MKEGWQTRALGAICEVVNGGTPKTEVEGYWDGHHLWITPAEMGKRLSPYVGNTARKITDAGLRNSSARMLPPRSVILSSRAPIGHLVINTEPMATNQGCKGLIPGAEIECRFLYYYLSSIVDLLNALGTGATFKELSGGKLKEIAIPVPPRTEQMRIVAILDEAFEGIATANAIAKKNLQNAYAIFESHRQSVFTNPGNGWVEKTLDEVAAEDCSLSYGIVQPGDFVEGGLPVVRPTDLTCDTITSDGLKRIDPRCAESYRRTTLQGGEMLLCVRGSTGVVSKAALELAGANVTRGIVPIRLNAEILAGDFGFHLMRAEPVQAQIRAKTYGAALMQINIGDLRRISLAYPSLNDQRTIAAQLDALDAETQRLARCYERKQMALASLKKSLLHQAFSGEL